MVNTASLTVQVIEGSGLAWSTWMLVSLCAFAEILDCSARRALSSISRRRASHSCSVCVAITQLKFRSMQRSQQPLPSTTRIHLARELRHAEHYVHIRIFRFETCCHGCGRAYRRWGFDWNKVDGQSDIIISNAVGADLSTRQWAVF